MKDSQDDFQKNQVSSCIIITEDYIEKRVDPTSLLFWKYVFYWANNQIKTIQSQRMGLLRPVLCLITFLVYFGDESLINPILPALECIEYMLGTIRLARRMELVGINMKYVAATGCETATYSAHPEGVEPPAN